MKAEILTIAIMLFMLSGTFVVSADIKDNRELVQKLLSGKNEIYYSYAELTDLLDQLQHNYSDIFQYKPLKKTYEGRDIWLVKISDDVTIDEEEPEVLFTGGMHGNEKPGYQAVIYSIVAILENYTSPNVNLSFTMRIRNIVNNTELYFIPMINPDGCEANTRKNRRPNTCIFGKTVLRGVDLCRNFDYNWEDADRHPLRYILIPKTLDDIKFLITHRNFHLFERAVVRYPASDLGSLLGSGFYRGPYPFSEPENSAIKEFVENHSVSIWLDYHIFGEEIRHPHNCVVNYPSDNLTFYSIAENISSMDGYEIYEDPVCLNSSGTALEWAYINHNIFGFVIEMCPSMKPKILNDKEFISEVFEEHLPINLYVAERAMTMD